MVEALDVASLRLSSPNPCQKPKDPNSDFLGSSHLPDAAQSYDRTIRTPTTINSGTLDTSGGGNHRRSDSMDADARKGMPESSKPDHARPAFHRRRSRSTAGSAQQRQNPNPHPHPHQRPPSPGYSIPLASAPENTHPRPPTDFRPLSLPFPSAVAPYSQSTGFVGQYTTSTQPGSMDMSHSPPPYPFSHNFHHSVVPDNSMISQNIHTNYPPMVRPHAPVFPYQGHPSEGISPAHQSFSGMRNPPTLYPPRQSHTSSAPTTPHLTTPRAPISQPFVGSSSFHSLQYPSSMSMPTFQYSTQAYPSSPIYQPQYPSPIFGQSYSSPAEPGPQVAWYYFSHLGSGPPPPQQYDPGPSYQHGHYNIGYPHGGHTGVRTGADTPFIPSSHQPSPSQAGSPTNHPMGSNPPFAQYPEDQPSSDSPGQLESAPPHHHGQIVSAGATAAPPRLLAMSTRQTTNERRRSYHPNPPAHRSEWVMWVGNIPIAATHDELWRFFAAPPDNQPGDSTNGVVSIFLIARSSCAFINYHSEENLQEAIARFDGVALRPNDIRCPRLVCRVRGQGGDLKAGVGYQRGMGMHTKWLREQKGKARETHTDTSEVSTSDDQPPSPGSISKGLTHAMSPVSTSSDDSRHLHPTYSNSSGSYASTTSSFLAKYFPKRYFILKSLTQASRVFIITEKLTVEGSLHLYRYQEDLDLSVQQGIWATQKHNEEILDQAFRTSQEVYLIFGVNKSREFYGYARMTSQAIRGQRDVQWAARPALPTSSLVRPSHLSPPPPDPLHPFFSPSSHRLVDESPMPLYGSSPSLPVELGRTPDPSNLRHSAPALLGEEYHKPALESLRRKEMSLDQRLFSREHGTIDGIELDALAPVRAMRINQGFPDGQESSGPSRVPAVLHAVAEERAEIPGPGDAVQNSDGLVIQLQEDARRGEVSWGDGFAVEWISTTRMPFARTRHLRNPWNRGKEIKVSRDGTELEPSIGEQLLREWQQSTT